MHLWNAFCLFATSWDTCHINWLLYLNFIHRKHDTANIVSVIRSTKDHFITSPKLMHYFLGVTLHFELIYPTKNRKISFPTTFPYPPWNGSRSPLKIDNWNTKVSLPAPVVPPIQPALRRRPEGSNVVGGLSSYAYQDDYTNIQYAFELWNVMKICTLCTCRLYNLD